MWFDVEKNGYTTSATGGSVAVKLWFDVEKNGYTTDWKKSLVYASLWFDVEKNGYTTRDIVFCRWRGCGLM